MKISYLIVFFLLLTNLSFAQRFWAETDVLYYLNNKSFTNKDVDLTVSFSEMGSQLTFNKIVCYEPDIKIISEFKAICVYYLVTDPSKKISGIINSLENTWTDRSNGRIYKLNNDINNIENRN